jgi:hypothetical protein
MGKVAKEALHQHWVHSHEEDTADTMVFRPFDYDFPLSRGRASFELQSEGKLMQHGGIAPDDRTQRTPGRWELQGDDKLAFYTEQSAQPSRVLQIKSIDKDRLVVKK